MTNSFSSQQRLKAIQQMQEQTFDVVIIGGGITGAGAARDAASRGLSVALVEASDFASGTSSRSSKLIHGGIRYLENLEFGLVFEALSERQRLFEIAPHLVHPLNFLIPLYTGGRVPPWKMDAGLWLYDALSLFEAPELHEFWSAKELAHEFPSLQQNQLLGGFSYSDAYMDDDRLVLETLRSAHSLGAVAANYVSARKALFNHERVSGIECVDQFSQKSFVLKGKSFIGSVGPWTDLLGENLLGPWKKMLRPSKGVHLTFLRERLPLKTAVVMGAESRIVFGIPRHEMVIVGTTDTDFFGDPSTVKTERSDVEYLLKVANQYFPGAQLTEKDIVASYAGVRPLIDDGASTESKTSREHLIWNDPRGITFVAGGKYTTYRNMAEQTIDHLMQSWSIEERAKYRNSGTVTALNPLITPELFERAKAQADEIAKRHKVSPSLVAALAERHGLEAEHILKNGLNDLRPLGIFANEDELLWSLEALHAIQETMCLSLTDFYFRRSPLVLARADHGIPLLKVLAPVMARALGWSMHEQEDQINALQKQLNRELGWKLTQTS